MQPLQSDWVELKYLGLVVRLRLVPGFNRTGWN